MRSLLPLIDLGLFLLIAVFAASPVVAQGNLDTTFGSNGATLTTIPSNLWMAGAERQVSGVSNNKIIVALTAPGLYTARRFDSNTGALDISFITSPAAIGGTATAGAMTVGSANEIYVAGEGNTANKCAVVKFNPNGTIAQIVSLALPAAYSGCNITSVKINGTKLYLWGTTRNTSFNRTEFAILRLNLSPLMFDPTWNGGFISTAITWASSSIIRSTSIAFDAARVYGSGVLNAPGPLSGTLVVGYKITGGFSQGQVSPSFGNRSINSPSAGNGVYLISGLVAGDMIEVLGNLYLNGNVPGQPIGNFGLVKLTPPATTAGSHVSYPTADLLGYDNGLRLVKDNSNNIISGGQCNILPTNLIDVGLAKYTPIFPSLTLSWNPSQLQVLRAGFLATTPTPVQYRDLRRITPGPNLELLLNSLIIQSTNKLIVVSALHTGGNNIIWLGRISN